MNNPTPNTRLDQVFDTPKPITIRVHQMKDISDTHLFMFRKEGFPRFDPERYRLAGEITITEEDLINWTPELDEVITEDPEKAYEYVRNMMLEGVWFRTQNLESHWNEITPCRSCMIGDVYEFLDVPYGITSYGFVPLERLT